MQTQVDLNINLFDYAIKIADGRFAQKGSYNSSKPFSPNYEVVGYLGELTYGLITNELPDSRLRKTGDSGFDFSKRVQVKASEKGKAQYLIEFVDKDFSTFDYYVFVTVDLVRRTGEITGWISSKEFQQKARRKNFGYGDRLAVPLSELNLWTVSKKVA